MLQEKLEVNGDERGIFVEAFKLPRDGQVSVIVVTPGRSRGNHYHLHKIETFLVIYGSATMQIRNRETNQLTLLKMDDSTPTNVTVHPNHTHTITASDEGAVVLVWANEWFDENDTDTYPEEV